MAGQLVGSHPPHVNHWINSYKCAKECTLIVVLYCSENHTFWQMRNCYCFLKLVHKEDAENSNSVNNFNWILRAKFCQSLFPLGNTFLYNQPIDLPEITVEVYIGCHTSKQESRTSLEHRTPKFPSQSISILLRLKDSIPYPRPSVLIPQGYQRGWMCWCWASTVVILFPSSLGTAWRPEQVLTSNGHDPFVLLKMSIQFPNSHPALMSAWIL